MCNDHLYKTKKTYLSIVHLYVYRGTEEYVKGLEV